MKYNIYYANNSKEIQNELANRGFYICPCCNFKNANWLHFYYRENNKQHEFHGIGNGCENECPGMNFDKCITCSLKESIEYSNTMIFNDIDDMCNFIKEYYK